MKKQVTKKLAFFFICPFLSSLLAVKNIRSQSSILIIVGFFLLFGLSFDPIRESEDSFRYAKDFYSFQKNADENLSKTINNYFSSESGVNEKVKDLYIYIMYYLASKIAGDNIHVLFFLFAIVFTFFCVGSLKFIINNKNFHYDLAGYALLFLFFFSNTIYNINGVRFWTASWCAIFITFQILLANKRYWIIGLMILPLIHVSFIFYVIIFCIAYVLRFHVNFLFKCFIISFILGQFGLIVLEYTKGFLPPLFQNMIWSYTESETALSKINGAEGEAFYATLLNALPRYYELVLLFIIGFNRNSLSKSRILGFTLAYFSIINIFAIVPSLGSRYTMVGYPMIIYLWIDSLPHLKKYSSIFKLIPVVYAYRFFRWIRDVLAVTPIVLYFTNFFHLIIKAFT